MAKQPRFVRDKGGDWKIAGYFEAGRYHFTLSADAERLLQEELGYYVGDPVPPEFFRTLVFAGDAWLPSFPEEPVEAGDDLVEPPAPDTMTDEEAQALADHLRGRRVGGRQRAALQDQIDRTPLGRYLTMAGLRETDDWVEHLPSMNEGDAADAGGNRATASDSVDDAGGHRTTASGSADAGGSRTTASESSTTDSGPTEGPGEAVPPPTDGHDGVPPADERTDVEAASVAFLTDLEGADPEFGRFSTGRLVDAYALLSEIESRVGDFRTDVRDVLAERVAEGREVSGRVGTVEGANRTRRSLKDEEEVLAAVDRHGLPRQAVLGMQVDEDRVEDLMEKADIDESAFYEISETDYVRRIDVDVATVERIASEERDGGANDGGSPGGQG